MSTEFVSNKAAVQAQFNSNMTKCLTAIGLKQNEIVVDEMDSLIYNQPPAKSGYVRKGRLRGGSGYRVGSDEVIVGNSVNYAIYVNCGTRYVPARPFMENSIFKHTETYKQICQDTLGSGF